MYSRVEIFRYGVPDGQAPYNLSDFLDLCRWSFAPKLLRTGAGESFQLAKAALDATQRKRALQRARRGIRHNGLGTVVGRLLVECDQRRKSPVKNADRPEK
ncbi:hypothetical protein BE61_01850 [Bradyrhizobium elkanii USDA 61]|nr:hypothetical protein BE61_01850 [Bradyrhizobium elkanii USDA 61]